MSTPKSGELILSIFPFSRGYAFVLFEGPESPFDWGVREIKEKHRNIKTIQSIKELVDRYRPEAMVIEDTSERLPRRTARIKKLYRMIKHLSAVEYVDLATIPCKDVKRYFSLIGARTKYEIAHAIAKQIPAFATRVPRFRKAWMSADPRQSLFDAAALGLVYYGSQGIPSPYDMLNV